LAFLQPAHGRTGSHWSTLWPDSSDASGILTSGGGEV
jgi:hypothetical protein